MVRASKSSILLISVLLAMAVGCNKTATSTGAVSNGSNSNSDVKPASPVSTDSNSNAQSAIDSQGEKTALKDTSTQANPDPVKMIGKYQMVQVQKGGVVSMISQRKVEISFSPNGTYSRVSKANDKSVHDDQGQYRIENGDQLVLTIQVSKKTIHNPPIEKRHKISLSLDGEELRMISETGDIAVFRKVK